MSAARALPPTPIKAAHWYELAADQGNRKAMHNLAVAYASGPAARRNMAEAARWFAKAAALGLSDSQFNLAVLYERGDGVPQSLIDAYKWYSIAAAAGDAESKARIGVLQTQLSDADRAAASKSAATFHAAPLNRSANVPPEPADLGNLIFALIPTKVLCALTACASCARMVAVTLPRCRSALMEIYLPVAEMSVNWLVIIALGTGVGFLSGMFGVGGGFLMTPLLVFHRHSLHRRGGHHPLPCHRLVHVGRAGAMAQARHRFHHGGRDAGRAAWPAPCSASGCSR